MDCFFTPTKAKAGSIQRIDRTIRTLMRSSLFLVIATVSFNNTHAQDRLVDHFPDAVNSGCMACHGEIEPIREVGSEMLRQIMEKGIAAGDPAGCIVCHNGDPNEKTDKAKAHGGEFFADPGSSWVNGKTCGQCHEDQVRVQWHSLMTRRGLDALERA